MVDELNATQHLTNEFGHPSQFTGRAQDPFLMESMEEGNGGIESKSSVAKRAEMSTDLPQVESKARLGRASKPPRRSSGKKKTPVGSPLLPEYLASPTECAKPRVLLRLAKSINAPGTSSQKALDCALQAVKFFDEHGDGAELELAASLHALAAVYCRLRRYGEAVATLERSIRAVSAAQYDDDDNLDHALSAVAGHMHLGDTYGLQGKVTESLQSYYKALELQVKAVGENDLRVVQTCRYLAEAHLQNLQFKEAEDMCQRLLKIHTHIGSPGSLEEAADRRLMALICSGKGDYETALEYLVLASMALISKGGQDLDVASIEVSIGDTYVSLGRYEDAVFAYQKALTVFKSANGEEHVSVASVYVSLANLYLKTGKQREARTYCDIALKLYAKHEIRHPLDEITSGLTEVAAIYGAMDEHEKALQLLNKVLDIVEAYPGHYNAIAAIEAQMGVLYFVLGKFGEALVTFKSAVMKLRATSLSISDKKNSFLGMLLNQMGLACVELYEIVDAAQCFQEAKNILEQACGPDDDDTIAVSANLAATYDALGRIDEAINLLRSIIKAKEEKAAEAGVNPDTENDKSRLNELLKEAGQQMKQR